jgi:predicted phosphate transport protein (TIGR00153 family)
MFGRLMPREGRFFELFNDHAEQLAHGARELAALISAGDDVERRAYNIESIEKRGDKIAYNAIELLHRTFITPIDRDDIHQLVSKMDDILDVIEDTSQSIYAYDVREITPEARRLAELCVACVDKVKAAVVMLSNMDNAKAIMMACQDIDRFESEADHVMRSAMAKLFRDEPDVKQVMKMRSVYEMLETVTDRCEDVANVIQAIVLENS